MVLSEGTVTEANYFSGIKQRYRLSSVVVRSLRPDAGGVAGLVSRAKRELIADEGLDEIYCVLDHDGRDSEVAEAVQSVRALDKNRRRTSVKPVLSVPCFEYWILLHFCLSTRPFASFAGGASACDQVIHEIRRHLPNYTKNDVSLFAYCEQHVETAIENAHRAATVSSEGAPMTDVGQLVARLIQVSVDAD